MLVFLHKNNVLSVVSVSSLILLVLVFANGNIHIAEVLTVVGWWEDTKVFLE